MNERKDHRRRVADIVKPHRLQLGTVAFASLASGFVEAAFLVVVTQTALAVTQDDSSFELVGRFTFTTSWALVLAALLVIARSVLALFTVWTSSRLSMLVGITLKSRLADLFLRASWATQQAEPAGRLQQLVGGFAASAVGALNAFITSIVAGLNLLALLVVALVVSPTATLFAVISLVVLGSVLIPLRRAIRRRAEASVQANLTSSRQITEFGALGLEMQTYGVRDAFSENIREVIESDALLAQRAQILKAGVGPIYTTLGYLALVGGLGAASAAGGDLASVGAVMLVMLRCLGYGQSLQTSGANLVAAGPFLQVVDETLKRYDGDRAPGGEVAVSSLGPLEADSVAFSYDGEGEVLSGVSFRIEPGEHVGVVGPSGSGKSTLVQLLLGLRTATSGSLTVAGHDLADVDRKTFSPLVAFVAQDAQLFAGTIAENIKFFRPEITRADIEAAAERARLGPDLAALTKGLDTHVGERGSQLSGGQRQRVSIARALAGNPQLLVLDEPTSALDVQSEVTIRDTIAALRGQITVVVIAHRLSTLEACDRVMVIQDGRMLAFAEPKQLASQSDFYRDAVALSNLK